MFTNPANAFPDQSFRAGRGVAAGFPRECFVGFLFRYGGMRPDGEASFELPNPDPTNSGTTVYSVFARALDTPGGKSLTTTCATDPYDGSRICSGITLTLDRSKGKSTFENVSKYLLYIYADVDGDGVMDRVPLFDTALYGYFWNYDNQGLKLAQLRFYNCGTTVPGATDPNGQQTTGCF